MNTPNPRPVAVCPYCQRTLAPVCRQRGALKRSLLAHLAAAHGPLRRRDVRALHALSGPALDRILRPPLDSGPRRV